MFKQIRSALIKRKFNKMLSVAYAGIDVVETRAALNVSVFAAMHRDITTRFIEDTSRDPAPLLDLMNAIEKVAEHYKPSMMAVIESTDAKVRAVDESPLVARLMRAFDAARVELSRD